MKKCKPIKLLLLCFAICIASSSYAQLTLTGQIRTRTEYRNGTGTLIPKTNSAAFFTSQRTRLSFNYKWKRIVFQTSLQDVRVWGQDASSISPADGSKLGLHEAWAEIALANKKDSSFQNAAVDYFAIKIGRQELLYDDSRLIGNLDWLQQARRHDAIVFKLLNKGWQVDIGTAFNQNTDAFNYNGTYYTPANVNPYVKDSRGNLVATPTGLIPIVNASGISSKAGTLSMANPPSTNSLGQHYKALQFLYAAKTFKQTKITALFVADEFSKYKLDSVQTMAGADTGYVFGRRYNQAGVNTRFTTGLLATSILDKKKAFTLNAGFYYQGGKDKEGLSLAAFTSTLSLMYVKNKFSYTAGWDYVSGNDALSSSTNNHRFDPLYGTPHKFWGLMDYFYAGTGSPTGGLNNLFAKIKYTSTNKRFSSQLDYHYFALAKNQKDVSGNAINKYLGSEFDLVSSYALNKVTTVELGVSYMAATKSMEYAKGITPGSANLNANWVYLQINIKPEFLTK
ncbi:MAG: alginate export family protein [Bacteroidota bacterium]